MRVVAAGFDRHEGPDEQWLQGFGLLLFRLLVRFRRGGYGVAGQACPRDERREQHSSPQGARIRPTLHPAILLRVLIGCGDTVVRPPRMPLDDVYEYDPSACEARPL